MISEVIYKDLLVDMKSTKDAHDVTLNRMKEFFQPYFRDEIYVDHQPSDGFVIIVTFRENGNDATNIPLNDAMFNIELEPSYYLDCDF